MRKALLVLALIAGLIALVPGPARTEDAPGSRECATILLTSLGYVTAEDPTAKQRLGDGVGVLALHNGELSSRTLCNDLAAAVKDWGKANRVGGTLSIRATDVKLYGNAEDLTKLINEGHYGIVFVSEGLRASVGDIARVASDSKFLTTCASKDYVELGFAIGFVVEESRLRIYVNRDAASREGFQFRTALLRRSTLVVEEARR
jgi:hypothetical protein